MDEAVFRLPKQEAVLRRMRDDATLDRRAVVGDKSQKRSAGRVKGTVEERLKKTAQLKAEVAAGKKTGIDTTANIPAQSTRGLGRGNPGRPRRCLECTAAQGKDVWLKECGGVRQGHKGREGRTQKEQEAVMNQLKKKEKQLEQLRAHLASVGGRSQEGSSSGDPLQRPTFAQVLSQQDDEEDLQEDGEEDGEEDWEEDGEEDMQGSNSEAQVTT